MSLLLAADRLHEKYHFADDEEPTRREGADGYIIDDSSGELLPRNRCFECDEIESLNAALQRKCSRDPEDSISRFAVFTAFVQETLIE
jgi:hypothetical protein